MNLYSIPRILILICCLASLADVVNAQNTNDSTANKLDTIFKNYNTLKGPGCAVSIIKNGKVIITKEYGMANLDYDIPVTSETLFDVASLSKQFTGMVVATLIQEGKISPDDDIHKYLPEVPQFGKKITIENLLYHTSGIRDWPEALHLAGWRWDEAISFADIMQMVKFQRELNFEPGSQFSYSNTGYNLLAEIVAKVTGKSLSEWEAQNIFMPLGMTHTLIQDDDRSIIKGRAVSYFEEGDSFGMSKDMLTAYGSSATFTSINDLSKWVINFQKSLEAADPVYGRMIKPGQLNNGKEIPYGYGLEIHEREGMQVISHDGTWSSYRSLIITYPQEELSFVLLSNADNFDPVNYAGEMAKVFLKHKFKPAPAPDEVKDAPIVTVSPALLQHYVGSFQLEPGWYVTFTQENGQLMVQATGEDKFPTEAKSDSVFWVPRYGAYFTFYLNRKGQTDSLKYRSTISKRVIPISSVPAQLTQYTGTYYSPELESEYKIYLNNDKLFIHHRRLGDFSVEADLVIKDEFHCDLGTLLFFRDKGKKVAGYRLSGNRVKHVKFDRR